MIELGYGCCFSMAATGENILIVSSVSKKAASDVVGLGIRARSRRSNAGGLLEPC